MAEVCTNVKVDKGPYDRTVSSAAENSVRNARHVGASYREKQYENQVSLYSALSSE